MIGLNNKDYRRKTTVENCTGGHVNVLSDYKKTWQSKNLKVFYSNCHHLIDMLTIFFLKITYIQLF